MREPDITVRGTRHRIADEAIRHPSIPGDRAGDRGVQNTGRVRQ